MSLESILTKSCQKCGERVKVELVRTGQNDYLEGTCSDCGYENSIPTNNLDGWNRR